MERIRFVILAGALSLAACAPVGQPGAPAAAPTPAAQAPAAQTPATTASAVPGAQPPVPHAAPIPAGSTVVNCTPIADVKPPPGQVAIAQPFSLVLDPRGRPLEFINGTLPAKIPFKVQSVEAASGPPEMRVGAVIRYAARDAEHAMSTELAIMKDGTYRLGLTVKTPQQSTPGPVNAGHGTCVDRPA